MDDHICQDTNCVKTGVFCNEKKHCNASLVDTACLDSGLCGCLNAGNCVEGAECSEEICVRIAGSCRTDEECEEEDDDFECVDNGCTRKAGSCAARVDCTGNSVGYNCVEGRCGCGNANADCPAGNLCKKAKCGCKGSADCERGGVCKAGKCKSKPSQSCVT